LNEKLESQVKMAFSILRACSRLTHMGFVERNTGVAVVTVFGNLQQQENAMTFSTTAPLRSTKKTLVEQAREFSKRTDTKVQRADQSDSDSDDSDSDDERTKKGDSEFWRRKMRTLHGLFDVNNDGVISFDDFVILADKFGDLGHLNPDEIEEFKSIMKSTWEAQWGEITPYNLITIEQYLCDMHHVVNDKSLRKKCHRFLPYIFQAVDHDRSGEISLNEFKVFFKCLGLTDEDAAVAFAMIDVNGDGKLSKKEFVKLGRDYFLNEDEICPSRMFWGPLNN
jgi:Ca2+-binding EF-hand superfamily protein